MVGLRLPMLPPRISTRRHGPVDGFAEPGVEAATPILRHLDGDLTSVSTTTG